MFEFWNMGDEPGSPLYQTLMSLKPEGMSNFEWARQAKVDRSLFNAIKRSGNTTQKTLEKLLSAINVDPARASEIHSLVLSEVRGTGLSTEEVRLERAAPNVARLPLVGSALGGSFSDINEHVELTELYLGDVLDNLSRPAHLIGDEHAYAVTIVGDSMEPRYKPSERVFVSPRASIGIGDDVIVQLKRGPTDDPEQAERVTMVLIKELVRRSSSFVELSQFQPPARFKIPAERVAAIHRVVGRF